MQDLKTAHEDLIDSIDSGGYGMTTGSRTAIEPKVAAFLARQPVGVVTTVRPDGMPRQSVTYVVFDGDRLLLSTLRDRGKAHDVARHGWASVCVLGHVPPYPSVTVEGPARVLTTGIGAATARIASVISGQDVAELSDEQLAAAGRVILEITIRRAYGASHIPDLTAKPQNDRVDRP